MSRGLRYGAVLVLGLSLPLQAQVVRGTLSEEGTGLPLEGAVVALVALDGDSAYARVLTDAEGTFVLRAPPGRWRVRAELIGHRTVNSDPFALGSQGTALELTASVEAVSLAGVEVTAGARRCVVRPTEDGLVTALAWEQARKVLESSFLTQAAEGAQFGSVLYQRELDPTTLRVREERSQPYRAFGRRPFVSAPPEVLAARGFVQETDSGTFYYAPDERVLLSDPFLDGHCFRVRGSEESTELLGLAFEPVRGRSLADIEGVLWLDAETAELRSLDFRYVNLRLDVPSDNLGGAVRFQRLPTGAWIARRWWIRMPAIELQQTRVMGRLRTRRILAGIHEEGAEVLSVESGGVRIVQLDRPRLQGLVFDSTRNLPLAGAEVYLVGTEHFARTDRYGRFFLTVPEGDFELAFRHPRLDTLGIRLEPIPVALHPEVVRQVRLAVPRTSTILAQTCPNVVGPALTGVVRDGSGRPVAGARVSVGWPASERPLRWRTTSADEEGRFLLCGAPAGADVLARATHEGSTSEERVVRLPVTGVATTELFVDTLRVARLSGRIVSAENGGPVAQASVRIPGTGHETTSDPNGRFVLADVPPGQRRLEFEHLLYEDRSEALEVESGAQLSLSVELASGAIELEPLTVTVEAPLRPGITGFRARSQSGMGFFLLEEQITRMQPLQMTDLFNAVPGLTVACGNPDVLGSGCHVQFERARALNPAGRASSCPVQYFLDGSSVSVEIVESLRPQNILGVEVYNGLSSVPPEFRRGPDTRCGVIAVWLKNRRSPAP